MKLFGVLIVWVMAFPAYGNECKSYFSRSITALEFSVLAYEKPTHVTVHPDRIIQLAKELKDLNYYFVIPTWTDGPYPSAKKSFNQMFRYYLVLNAINYSYFNPRTGETFADDGNKGAAFVADRLTRHFDKMTNPEYLSSLTKDKLEREVFYADQSMPMIEERVISLRLTGEFLKKHADTNFEEWIKRFPSAVALAQHISRDIPAFDDPFLKRSQLFVGMLMGRFPKQTQSISNLEGFTVYADYMLPMILHRMGVFSYSPALLEKIQKRKLIPSDSPEEVEIRAATILASEFLLKELKAQGVDTNILAIDAALWIQSKEILIPQALFPEYLFRNPETPHHQTITTDY